MAKTEKQASKAEVPEPAVNLNRRPLPDGNWVEFEGQLRLGEFWKMQRADAEGDTFGVAEQAEKLIKKWSFAGDPHDLDPDNEDSWGGFDFATYLEVVQAVSAYLNASAETGN